MSGPANLFCKLLQGSQAAAQVLPVGGRKASPLVKRGRGGWSLEGAGDGGRGVRGAVGAQWLEGLVRGGQTAPAPRTRSGHGVCTPAARQPQ